MSGLLSGNSRFSPQPFSYKELRPFLRSKSTSKNLLTSFCLAFEFLTWASERAKEERVISATRRFTCGGVSALLLHIHVQTPSSFWSPSLPGLWVRLVVNIPKGRTVGGTKQDRRVGCSNPPIAKQKVIISTVPGGGTVGSERASPAATTHPSADHQTSNHQNLTSTPNYNQRFAAFPAGSAYIIWSKPPKAACLSTL